MIIIFITQIIKIVVNLNISHFLLNLIIFDNFEKFIIINDFSIE